MYYEINYLIKQFHNNSEHNSSPSVIPNSTFGSIWYQTQCAWHVCSLCVKLLWHWMYCVYTWSVWVSLWSGQSESMVRMKESKSATVKKSETNREMFVYLKRMYISSVLYEHMWSTCPNSLWWGANINRPTSCGQHSQLLPLPVLRKTIQDQLFLDRSFCRSQVLCLWMETFELFSVKKNSMVC